MRRKITEIEFKVVEYHVMEFYDQDDETPAEKIIVDNWERGKENSYDCEYIIERVRHYD